MENIFPFYPEAASSVAQSVDQLYFFLVAMTVVLTVLIFGVVVYFAVKYRRRSESECPPEIEGNLKLEILWSVIPLAVCMVIFFWSAKIYIHLTTPPADAVPIYVVGKQWMWKIQHADGRAEINSLHVPVNTKFRLIMTSEDVIHSFYMPEFRLKSDVVPGKYTSLWFEATKVGTYKLFCAEYCGTSHAAMKGRIVVMSQADYQDWLTGSTQNESMDQVGKRLFTERKCITCHHENSGALGPSLAGVFGRTVELSNGATLEADENYLRESILNPRAKTVKGYQNIMPTYDTQLSEVQVMQIIAYLKTLKSDSASEGAQE